MKKTRILLYTSKNKFLHKIEFRWLITWLIISLVALFKLWFNNKKIVESVLNFIKFMSKNAPKNYIYSLTFKFSILASFIILVLSLFVIANLKNISKELAIILKIKLVPKYIIQFVTTLILTSLFYLILVKVLDLSLSNILTWKIYGYLLLISLVKITIVDLDIGFWKVLYLVGEFLVFGSFMIKIANNIDSWVFIYTLVSLIFIFVIKLIKSKIKRSQVKRLKPFNMYTLYLVNYIRQNPLVILTLLCLVSPFILEKHLSSLLTNTIKSNFKFNLDVVWFQSINIITLFISFLVIMKTKILKNVNGELYFKSNANILQSLMFAIFTFQILLTCVFNYLNNVDIQFSIIYIFMYIFVGIGLFVKFKFKIDSLILAIVLVVLPNLVSQKVIDWAQSNTKIINNLNLLFLMLIFVFVIVGYLIVSYKRSKKCLK